MDPLLVTICILLKKVLLPTGRTPTPKAAGIGWIVQVQRSLQVNTDSIHWTPNESQRQSSTFMYNTLGIWYMYVGRLTANLDVLTIKTPGAKKYEIGIYVRFNLIG